MDDRKQRDNKRFDLAFEAIDDLYRHANSNDLVKATSERQNIKMRPSYLPQDHKGILPQERRF
jgi:hypothetical protein